MQDPKTSPTRTTRPWYQKAMQMATLWRTLSKSSSDVAVTADHHSNNANRSQRLRKSSSVKVASSLSRVCLCAPISSYKEVLRAEMQAPRRSNSYPRAKPSSALASPPRGRTRSARHGSEVRRVIFRGKSLTDDVLMRRFVVEEEAMMQVRRRNQMEVIRKRSVTRRKKLGPSRLCRMVMADS